MALPGFAVPSIGPHRVAQDPWLYDRGGDSYGPTPAHGDAGSPSEALQWVPREIIFGRDAPLGANTVFKTVRKP